MNYVLFYPDEMRAESLHCYGNPLARTPNIDALAAEGTLFENNYTQHPVCVASRCALVTGWYPHVNGYRTLAHMVDRDVPNFIRTLRRNGFATCLSAKNHVFTEEALADTFDEIVRIDFHRGDAGRMPPEGEDLYNMIFPAEADGTEAHLPDSEAVAAGIDFINMHAGSGRPFFLFQSLIMPHPPYKMIEKYYHMYDPAEVNLRSLRWLENKPDFYRLIRRYRELDLEENEIFRRIQAIYLGMISYSDMLLGRVVEALKANGVYDDTTILFCSDHGDFAGDAGLLEKWPSGMDDMLTRVPLIVRRPGAKQGHRVSEPTQSIDIFPTIFDYEGLDIGWDQFGVSLRGQIEGAAGDAERCVYCEGGYDRREPHCFEGGGFSKIFMKPGTVYYPKMLQQQELPESVCRVVMQRDMRYKLNVRTNGQNELYDMQADPQEYNNLYNDPAYREIREERIHRMLSWLISTSDVVPRKGHI